MELENAHRDFWQVQARRITHRVNFAWWLETLSAPLVVGSVVGAVVVLLGRREFPEIASWKWAAAVGIEILAIAVGSWVVAIRKFESPTQSLVRIEAAMKLRNALTAATAGVAPWPAPAGKTNAGLTWQWSRLLVPALGSLALFGASLFLPVAANGTQPAGSAEQPQAWKQLASELDHLAKEEVVDETYLEETRKRLEELETQNESQWFSHASLEATDALEGAHRAESNRVSREMGRAEKALGDLVENAQAADETAQNRMVEAFEQALQGLQTGAMKPNPELLEQIKQLDLKGLSQLDPEQLKQLREALKKHARALKGDQPGEGGEEASDDALGENGEDPPDGAGEGGVERGPGHAPGTLGEAGDQLDGGALTGLKAKDLSLATPGDLLELHDGEHEIDPAASRATAGGDLEATGKGGDRVWRDALDPAEQRTLKRYFK